MPSKRCASNAPACKDSTPTSLDFEIAYTVTSPTYADLVKASHQVNLAVLDLINQLGLRPGAVTLTLSKDAKPF